MSRYVQNMSSVLTPENSPCVTIPALQVCTFP